MLVFAKTLFAQTDVKALEASLKGKQRVLRSYSADPIASYEWVSGGLQQGPVSARTVGVFVLDKIKEDDYSDVIILLGKRATLVRNGEKNNELEMEVKVPMSIRISLAGANRTEVLPQLDALLFFSNLQQAIDSVPNEAKDTASLPYTVGGKPEQAACNCVDIFVDGQWKKVPSDDAKLTLASVISGADPVVTDIMRQAGISEITVGLKYYVSGQGKIEDVWLARSAGYGTDEVVEKSFENRVMAPATYDGRPVGIWRMGEITVTR